VQAAIDSVPENNRERIVITIKSGIYSEVIRVPKTKPFLTFRGAPGGRVVLTFNNYATKTGPDGRPLGTARSASVFVQGDDFIAENVVFENSATPRKVVGQALALSVSGDRAVFRNCRFLGRQDTLYTGGQGRQYFRDCYIEGDVDFIFGSSAAVFENSRVHSTGPGYITAHARTAPDQPTGYVFRNCELTGSTEAESVYLGRPWRPYGRVVFIDCRMGPHIRLAGWDNWRKKENEATAWFAEHGSTGLGANAAARVPWSRQLSLVETAPFAVRRFLSRQDAWNPEAAPKRQE
jgi:pectinesterase